MLPNRRGARWNPPETAGLYTSLDRATVLAEMEHLRNLQTPPVARALFRLHRVRLGVEKMLDLRDLDLLEMLGVSQAELVADESAACRRVGGAAAWLGRDAILVPSARGEGENLVVFVDQQDPDALLEVIWSGPVEE